MNYTVMIAAAFILATIAIAALSPFDHLPHAAPQQTAAAAPADSRGSSDDSSYDDSSSFGGNSRSNVRAIGPRAKRRRSKAEHRFARQARSGQATRGITRTDVHSLLTHAVSSPAPSPLAAARRALYYGHVPRHCREAAAGHRRRALQDRVEFKPAGDQPQAIADLIQGLTKGERDQVLLGVTGSGKTFTMAQCIEALQRPTLILAPNKTLAAQLYGEMKGFFPDNAVEYFVSYYDYYQPEAYVARTDTYIEKESSINEQIDRMRHSATRALFERRDVVIVASVSCIYGIGSPRTIRA